MDSSRGSLLLPMAPPAPRLTRVALRPTRLRALPLASRRSPVLLLRRRSLPATSRLARLKLPLVSQSRLPVTLMLAPASMLIGPWPRQRSPAARVLASRLV